MPMNPTVKALWIEALESGEYTQGTGVLRTNENKFCCLGVLCDLAEKAGIVESTLMDQSEYRYFAKGKTVADGYYGSTTGLFDVVMEWSGIESGSGFYKDPEVDGDYESNLIGLNDALGFDFVQIADVIRRKF